MSNADWETGHQGFCDWEADPRATRLVEPYPIDDCKASDANSGTLEDIDQPHTSVFRDALYASATRCHDEHGELGKYGLGRDVSERCIMPPLTFEDFWFRISVRHRIVMMDWPHRRRRSPKTFEDTKLKLSLMLASLDGRVGEVLVQNMYHEFHTEDLFDIFTMDFAGCRPVKLEDTYDWICLDLDGPIYNMFFCTWDGHSDCTRSRRTDRGWSNNDTGFKIGLKPQEHRKAASAQDQESDLGPRSDQTGKGPAFECVGTDHTIALDDSLKRRLHKLPQELYDQTKDTLLDITLGPRYTSLEGKLYPNVLRAFNREFYHQRKETWLSSKLWTTFPHYPFRSPRNDTGGLTPISIPRELRKEVKQLSVTLNWSGLCQGCVAWLDTHHLELEKYPAHWLPWENMDRPVKNMFDVACEYLETVKAANADILEAWVHELSVIHDLALDLLVLDARSAYDYSGEYIGLDVVKEALRCRSHRIGTLVVMAPNKAFKEEILKTLEDKRSASDQWW